MRQALTVLFGLALATTAHAIDGAPSQQVLAEMGLADLQVMSDAEATAVRGTGFEGLNGFWELQKGIRDFHKQVKSFHKEVERFHKQVKKHDSKNHNGNYGKSHGMKPPKTTKPPKMSHGSKPW